LVLLVLATGESGHHRVIERALKENALPAAAPALIARGTGNRVCLGNKGSLHVRVVIRGRSYHPSNPAEALNAIDGAEAALGRLREFAAANTATDPDLGSSLLVPIGIESRPKGPIIPDECAIEVSGRLVPGQDPQALAAGLREALALPGGFRTEVTLERFHFPAKVAPDHPLSAAAREAVRKAGGNTEPLYMHASLDAGYFCRRGGAAVSLGPGAPELAHSPSDVVSLKELEEGARIYLSLFRRMQTA
ncbi:MAG: M20 family metallopeptidase, partial [Nitrospinota bacterium]